MRMFGVLDGGSGVPVEPDWASEFNDELDIAAARERWRILISELREAQTLAIANAHAIRRAVWFQVIFDRAARQITETGTVIRVGRAKRLHENPNWRIARGAAESARAEEAELGMSPRRRGSVTKVSRAKKNPRPADTYLRPVAK